MEQGTGRDLTLTQPLSTSLTISKAVSDSKPVKQLINEGYSQKTIEGALAARILEASSMLHIGGNLTPHEPVTIAQMLIQEYPTSSMEDFTLMLQRGIIGRYGKIYGFDISVVFGWMGMYMEEWAEERERQLAKEKNKLYEQPEPNAIPRPDIDKLLNDFKETLRDSRVKSTPQLTPEEIRKEGQSTPRKKASNYEPDPMLVLLHEKKMKAIRDRGLDKVRDGELIKFEIEGKVVLARTQEEAQEIYLEVYE